MTSSRLLLLFLCTLAPLFAEPAPLRLWPGRAPGETAQLPPEGDTTKPTDDLIAGRRLIRLGNVSDPTLTIYPAPSGNNTGAAVLVCPGGGYHILAQDLEGTEVCDWLNSIGVTAVLLKYRVPARPGLPPHVPALQDAQRALGLVRARAGELGLDPNRIGALGFSAGGHLAAMLGNHAETRSYPRLDGADDVSCRPDFVVLIYPGYLALAEKQFTLNPDLNISAQTPPTLLVMAEDDPVHVENALVYYSGLKQAGVPAELHLYPKGGHGYGLRRVPGRTVTTWPDRVSDWLRDNGWLKGK